ncbi:MAG: hypothetical protein ABFD92_18235 [Planctomycetaceae bacterium]|nr:hypothetical protein [Planctomycetaceae bacterium]
MMRERVALPILQQIQHGAISHYLNGPIVSISQMGEVAVYLRLPQDRVQSLLTVINSTTEQLPVNTHVTVDLDTRAIPVVTAKMISMVEIQVLVPELPRYNLDRETAEEAARKFRRVLPPEVTPGQISQRFHDTTIVSPSGPVALSAIAAISIVEQPSHIVDTIPAGEERPTKQ